MPGTKNTSAGIKKVAKPHTWAIISFIVTSAVCIFIVSTIILYKMNIEHLTMEQLAVEKSLKIKEVISRLMYKTHIVSTFVHHYKGNIDDFDQLAATIVDDNVIKNLLLAPNGIVSQVYPLHGNEEVLGLNFFAEGPGNKEAILAKAMGTLVFGGPFASVQGGHVVVGRLPIYQKKNGDGKTFWGLVSITLKFPQVLEDVGLKALGLLYGFAYELWRINPDDGEKQVIADGGGAGATHGPSIEKSIAIFNAVWHLRLSVTRTWYEYPENWVMGIFALFISLLIALIVQKSFEMKELSTKLERLAHTDTLTGVFNRHYFVEFTSTYIRKMERTNENAYIVMFDLDHFKKINDTYGHAAGDEVLRSVAGRIRASIRPYDVFARYGGEEFILFSSGVDEVGIVTLVERCRRSVESKPVEHEKYAISVTASFGIAGVNPNEGLNVAIMLADYALYQAKKGGRNRFVMHNPDAGTEMACSYS
jgi:diguanylate cyclase (GGDEF)-like protein